MSVSTAIGFVLGWLLTLGMALLGFLACLWPAPVSHLYGAPQQESLGIAWVRAAGLRDLGLSLSLAIFLSAQSPRAAAVVALATALVAIGDFSSILALRGRSAALPLGVHFSGIAMGLASAAFLAAG
jgi:hypothetical protein